MISRCEKMQMILSFEVFVGSGGEAEVLFYNILLLHEKDREFQRSFVNKKKKKGRGVVGEGMFPKFPQFPKRFILDRNPVKIWV